MGTIFHQGIPYTGLGTPNTWGEINGTLSNQSDLQTILNTKQNTLTFDNVPTSGSSNPVKSGGVYSKQVHEITRTGVTATAGTAVRIPASGTDSRISTANTCVVKPLSEAKSDGTPYKYRTCKVYSGYVEITYDENISNIAVGIEVVNY